MGKNKTVLSEIKRTTERIAEIGASLGRLDSSVKMAELEAARTKLEALFGIRDVILGAREGKRQREDRRRYIVDPRVKDPALDVDATTFPEYRRAIRNQVEKRRR